MKKPRIFLKNVEVSLEKDAYAAGSGIFSCPDEELCEEMLTQLTSVFALPDVPSEDQILETDLGIAVVLLDYPARKRVGLSSKEWTTPQLRRQVIKLRATLSLLCSGEVVREFTVEEGPSLPLHLGVIAFTFEFDLNSSDTIDREELGVMLNKASLDLMKQVVSFAYR